MFHSVWAIFDYFNAIPLTLSALVGYLFNSIVHYLKPLCRGRMIVWMLKHSSNAYSYWLGGLSISFPPLIRGYYQSPKVILLGYLYTFRYWQRVCLSSPSRLYPFSEGKNRNTSFFSQKKEKKYFIIL